MNKTNYKTSLYMTKYEKAKIIGMRALHIRENAPVQIDTQGETDPRRIALMELNLRKVPLKVSRRLPDGSVEVIPVKDLIF